MKNILKSYILFILAICLGFLVSCDDDDNLGAPDRLFRPIVNKTTISGTWFKVEWERYQGAREFELELSIDSFANIIQHEVVDTTEYTFEKLDYNTTYQYRIKSIGDNISSEYFIGKNVTTMKFPTKLKNPTSADVIDNQARISWEEVVYTTLNVYLDGEIVQTIELTAQDNDTKEIIISDLEPEKTYVVKAYYEGIYLGEMEYKTSAPEQFDGDVVDLRELDEEDAYGALSQAYFNELAESYPNGVTLVLAGGTRYEAQTVNFKNSKIKLVTGLSLKGYALIEVQGSYGVLDATTVDRLEFEKIFFTDHPSKPRSDSNFGGTYLFNFNKSGAKLNELVIKECEIKYKRGAIRMQTLSEISKIEIESCLFDSIGGYGIINNGNDQAYIGDITVKNSTISHSEKVFVGGKKLGINSITVENVTMCYAPKGSGSYFFDYNGNSIPGGVVIKNCLFGPGWGSTVHGIRSKASNVVLDKNYCTSDLSWTLNEATGTPASPIELEKLSEDASAIFEDPEQNDYTITLEELVSGKIGDPRWW